MHLRSNLKGLAVLSFLTTTGLLCHTNYASACARNHQAYYEGQLEVFEKFQESKTGKGPIGFKDSKLVAIEIKRKGHEGTIDIRDPNTGALLFEQMEFSRNLSPKPWHLWKITLKVPGLLTKLTLRENNGCFKGKSLKSGYTAEVCMKKNRELRFDVRTKEGKPVLHLGAAPYHKPSIPDHRPLTLKQAIKIALDTNPQSKAEFLTKRQARVMLDTAWLKLLPRMSAPTLASLWLPLPTTPQSYVQNIGSIAPFLSITNWANIADARKYSEIADLGFTIFQANLINQVEQSVFIYRKDLLLTTDYNELLEKIRKASDQVKKIKAIEPGSQLIAKDAVDDLDQALQTAFNIVKDASIANSLANDKHAIAQTLGIHDLEIIRDIKIGPESVPIETLDGKAATKLSHNKEADLAAETSLRYMERLQALKATEEAQLDRGFHPFKLFDPVGDASDGIGFNLIAEFKLDKTMVKAALENEKTVADAVSWTVKNAVQNYNDAIDGYQNAKLARDRLKARLDELLAPIMTFQFETPKTVTIPVNQVTGETVETTVKDYLTFVNQAQGYQAAFRMARSTIERAKLVYDYEQLKPQKDQTGLDPSSPKPIVAGDDAVVDDNIIDMEKESGTSYHLAVDAKADSYKGKVQRLVFLK